jgi:membrane protein insertase Oxa1/YidC/SpoIIIJ
MLIAGVWHDYLYNPLLNLLFFLYGGPAFGNLGLAIVELTVLLRLALLPFTVLEERSSWRYGLIREKLDSVARDFKNDAVRRKEKVRELLAEHRINYWSKSVTLIVQGVVLVLLYQVFIGGIRFTSHESLYTWVSPPASVNTDFFGWDISARSFGWAAAVGIFLFVSIYLNLRRESRVTRGDVLYAIGFPIFTVLLLLLLPMMKSLFIMTSLIFGRLVHFARLYFFKSVRS